MSTTDEDRAGFGARSAGVEVGPSLLARRMAELLVNAVAIDGWNERSPVRIDGFHVGTVNSLSTREDKAVATVALPNGHAP